MSMVALRIAGGAFASVLLLASCSGGIADGAQSGTAQIERLEGTGYHCYEGPSGRNTPGLIFSVNPMTGEKNFVDAPFAAAYSNLVTIGPSRKVFWESRTVSGNLILDLLALGFGSDLQGQYAVNFGYHLNDTRELLSRSSDGERTYRWFNEVFVPSYSFNPALQYYVIDDVLQAKQATVQVALDTNTAARVSGMLNQIGRDGNVRRASDHVFENVYQGQQHITVCYKVMRFTAQRDMSVGSITYVPTQVSDSETLFR